MTRWIERAASVGAGAVLLAAAAAEITSSRRLAAAISGWADAEVQLRRELVHALVNDRPTASPLKGRARDDALLAAERMMRSAQRDRDRAVDALDAARSYCEAKHINAAAVRIPAMRAVDQLRHVAVTWRIGPRDDAAVDRIKAIADALERAVTEPVATDGGASARSPRGGTDGQGT